MKRESKRELVGLALKMSIAGWTGNKTKANRMRDELMKKAADYLGLTIQVDSLRIGITGRISAAGVLVSYKQVQLLIGTVTIRLSIAELLKRAIKINSMVADNVECRIGAVTHFSHTHAVSNGILTVQGFKKYYQLAFRMFGAVLANLPAKVHATNMNVLLHFRNREYALSCHQLVVDNGQYKMQAGIPELLTGACMLQGTIDVPCKSITLDEARDANGNTRCEMLFGNELSYFQFDRLLGKIALSGASEVQITAEGKGFEIVNRLVSSGRTLLPHWELSLKGGLENDLFCIERTSGIVCDLFRCELSVCHLFLDDSLDIRIRFDNISLKHFMNICPDYVCRELQTIEYTGTLSLEAQAIYFIHDPEKSSFQARLNQDQFILNRKNHSAFRQLSDPFIHRIRENDLLIKSIDLSDQNPSFMAFNYIPEKLIATIICTEDPNFFSHKGIDQLFIGYAMLQNLQEGRIVRGGSTITMQVVRNLYLGHKRNLYRKLEELFIAWLLEEGIEIPKKRILEIYLNIIEFGPGIYGIKEASRYYFAKDPAELSITECIVLSYIIPRPKYFEDALLSNSKKLRTNLKKHIEFVSRSLLLNDIIKAHEYEDIRFDIPICNTILSLQ